MNRSRPPKSDHAVAAGVLALLGDIARSHVALSLERIASERVGRPIFPLQSSFEALWIEASEALELLAA